MGVKHKKVNPTFLWVQQAHPRLWPLLCKNYMACELNVNRPNILPENEGNGKKNKKGREWRKPQNQLHLTIRHDFFSRTLYSTSSIRIYKKGTYQLNRWYFKSIYNVSIWNICPSPIHMNYIVYEQFNNLVHSPLKLIYYVSIWICETHIPIHKNYIIYEKSLITYQFIIHHSKNYSRWLYHRFDHYAFVYHTVHLR